MNIAVFDSGMGGITVLKELRLQFPQLDFYYYGDTANVPYGPKTPSQIKGLVQSAVQEIKKKKVDALIIACNTASCIALEECREIMGSIPVYSVVEAGIRTITRALHEKTEPTVVIFGTKATVRSKAYSTALKSLHANSIDVFEQACPLLVPMIEEGWVNHPILHATVRDSVHPFQSLKPGIAFLACTHYPWIREAFEAALPGWTVMDSASLVAEMLSEDFGFRGISGIPGKIEWHLTDGEMPSLWVEKTRLI